MSAERSEIRFGQSTIAYTVHRGRRQKTVAVAVDPVEGVLLRAPAETPITRLDEIVRRKAKWIITRQRRHEDLPPPPSPREFVSGETFLYLGRQYRLKIIRGGKDGSVRLVGGYLRVTVPRSVSLAGAARKLLVEWYRDHAAARIPERVAFWTPIIGVEPADVLIRDQRKRWGSADASGRLRFNWRVIQAPMRLVDYVVAHELVHLEHEHHTRNFWTSLGAVMPDYEDRRERLRQLGRAIVW